jgi:hypothetical protein
MEDSVMKIQKLLAIAVTIGLFLGVGVSAMADNLSVYSASNGSNPGLGGASSYASVGLSQGTNQVTVTVTAGKGSNDWDLAAAPGTGEYSVGQWWDSTTYDGVFWFNVAGGGNCNDVSITAVTTDGGDLSKSQMGCSSTPTTVDGFGQFALEISAPEGTDEIESFTFTYTATGVTVANLTQLSTQSAPDGNGYFAAFVTDGGDDRGSCDGEDVCGFVRDQTTSVVPEPGTLTLFGTGLLSIVGLLRRKFSV